MANLMNRPWLRVALIIIGVAVGYFVTDVSSWCWSAAERCRDNRIAVFRDKRRRPHPLRYHRGHRGIHPFPGAQLNNGTPWRPA